MSAFVDQRAKPRIVVTLSEGVVARVAYDNIDLAQVDLICIDTDTQGADDDQLHNVGGARVFFSVGALDKLSDTESRDIGRAYLAWGLEAAA